MRPLFVAGQIAAQTQNHTTDFLRLVIALTSIETEIGLHRSAIPRLPKARFIMISGQQFGQLRAAPRGPRGAPLFNKGLHTFQCRAQT